ncbi:MAG: hypothetical protein RLZZ229_505 [Actinomycetota bacterium]
MSEDSAAKHRAKQTARNLTLSIIACLGIVLATVLIVPRDDSNRIQPVDYKASAISAEAASGKQILAPELPQGWWANRAKWTANPTDGVAFWKVGFVGPKNQWIGMTQAFEVNPTWVALLSKDYAPDLEAIDSNPNWTKWATQDEGSEPTLWTLAVGNDLVALNGSGTAEEFAAFATIIETEVIK